MRVSGTVLPSRSARLRCTVTTDRRHLSCLIAAMIVVTYRFVARPELSSCSSRVGSAQVFDS